MKTGKFSATLATALLALVSDNAACAVTETEAAALGKTLTPAGAEQAGNASGSIPAFGNGLARDAASIDEKGFMSDPYAEEQPLFVITAQNAAQYKDKLTEGQLKMLAKYPDTYTLPVYETHRSITIPAEKIAAIKYNATHTRLTEDGNGLKDIKPAVAFPIPRNGVEAVWNHVTRFRGESLSRTVAQIATQANGDYRPIIFDEHFTFPSKLKDYNPDKTGNIIFFYRQEVTAPPRLAGQVTLVHETLNQVSQPRMAWVYSAGQRRVRRAPDVAYDTPGTASDGLRTADNLDMYNGAPNRYEWTLVGKREAYIPYNNYRLASSKIKYDDIIRAGHINQQHVRYELHRVWEVTATLKPGVRHIYAQRRFLLDEDTWQIVEADHYDVRGNLWRVAEAFPLYYFDKQIPTTAMEVIYDLQSGRYLAMNLRNEQPADIDFAYLAAEADYSPGALRTTGVR